MLKLLKERNRLNETLFLILISLVCFGLSILRFMYTNEKRFLFLNRNLFLAFIPWALTSFAIIKPNIQKNKITIFILLASWLLFFPNSPYILTDLFHLSVKTSAPKWFDLVLVLTFAWTGLLFGFFSLLDIERILSRSINRTLVKIISIVLIFLSSFGVYIGRYLRWNSWDVITEPLGLVTDVGERMMNPNEHPSLWGVTIFMGIFLNIIYWSFRIIKNKDK
jgi:uncharacterized membrane protein